MLKLALCATKTLARGPFCQDAPSTTAYRGIGIAYRGYRYIAYRDIKEFCFLLNPKCFVLA